MKNPYIKWLAKLLLFIFACVPIDYLVGLVFNQLRDSSFETNFLSQEFTCSYCVEKATPDVAIIGSSTANHHYIPSIMEDSLGLSVYNFGMDGCFFYFQNVLINLMLDRYSPSIIIWEIGESSLSNAFDNYKEYQSIKHLYPYYSKPIVKNFIDNKDEFQKIRMLSSCYRNNSDLLMYLRLCLGSSNSTSKGYLPLYNTKDYPSMKNFIKSSHFVVSKKIDVLNQTIKRCQEAGVTLVVTSSPRYFTNDVKSTDYYHALKDIISKNNIFFLDYYNSEPFCHDSTLFKDNAHMNNDGAVLYMSMFIPSLKQSLRDNVD